MVEPREEAKHVKTSAHQASQKSFIHNLYDIDKLTKKEVTKKCYPQTRFNPLDHQFSCNQLENQIHCHLYAVLFSSELHTEILENIKGDCSLGFVYWNNTLDQKSLDLELNHIAHAKLEYIGEMAITLEQYKTFVLIDRFFTASIRSWDANFFELIFKEYPVIDRSSLNKKVRELENIYLPQVLAWKDVRYSFFVALDNKTRRPDLSVMKQILEHLEAMIQYYLHFRVPDNQETFAEDPGFQKLKADEKFINAFKADPAKVAETTVVQNVTNFSKFVIANAAPLTKVDLLSLKLGKNSMQSRAMFYLERHFDYPINKDDYICHLKSYANRLSAVLKGGKTNAKDRKKTDNSYEAFYSFVSELKPYPINVSQSLQLLLAERIVTQIRDNERVLHFKENKLKVFENAVMPRLGQKRFIYEIQVHQSINKMLFPLTENANQTEENPYVKTEKHMNDDTNISYTENINIEKLKTALSGRSYSLEHNYENLEFLGDTILKLLSSIEVFVLNPSDTEEGLTDKRKNIISNSSLCEIATSYHFYEYILLKNDGAIPLEALSYKKILVQDFNNHEVIPDHYQHIPDKTLADVLEAITGVYYLQNGSLLEAAQRFLFMIGVLHLPRMYPKFKPEGAQSRNVLKSVSNFNTLEELIGYRFENPSLLFQAFTHSSASNVFGDIILTPRVLAGHESPAHFSYDRLEFLGDAVIDFMVVDYIFREYKQLDPGILSLMKTAAVNNQSLAMISLNRGFENYVISSIQDFKAQAEALKRELNGRKEHMHSHHHHEKGPIKTLGDVFEALIGAVFVDCKFNYQLTAKVFMGLAKEEIANLIQREYAEYNNKGKKI